MSRDTQNHIRRTINEGNELARAQRYREAIDVLARAAAAARMHHFADEEMQALLSLSGCYASVDRRQMRGSLERALELAKTLKDLVAEGKCYLNLGSTDEDRIEGIRLLRSALKAFETAQYELGVAQALDNLAVCYRVIGSPRLAAAYLGRAQGMFERLGDPFARAKNLRLQADLLTDIADAGLELPDARPRARANYLEAISLFENLGATESLAACRDALGLLERNEGHLEAAILLHTQAAHELADRHSLRAYSSALLHLATALRESGRPEEALQLFPRLVALKRSLQDGPGLLNVAHNEAAIRNDLADYVAARSRLVEVIEGRFRQIRSIYYPQTATGVLQEYATTWSEYLFAAACLAKQSTEYEIALRLLLEIEQSKFNVMGRGMSAAFDASVPEAARVLVLDNELRLRRRYRAIVLFRQQLREALADGTLQREVFDLRIDRLIARGYVVINALHALYVAHPPQVVDAEFRSYRDRIERAVRQRVEEAGIGDHVLLHLSVLRSRREILAVALTRGGSHIASLKLPTDGMETLVGDYRRLLSTSPGPAWESHLTAISEQLGEFFHRLGLTPLLTRDRPVVLVAASELHLLPWQVAALGTEYVGTCCALTQSLSLALSTPAIGSEPTLATAHVFRPLAVDLPQSTIEAEAISALLQRAGIGVTRFDGQAASVTRLMASIAEGPSILHFCGHSEFDLVDSGLSRLIAHGGRRATAGTWLTAAEIEALNIRRSPRIVYLSSCHSAGAEMRPGDEPIGLLRAFFSQGTQTVAATSWPTLDSSAGDLSTAFYETLCSGASVTHAAREARTSVLRLARAGKYPEKASFVHWGPLAVFGSPQTTLM